MVPETFFDDLRRSQTLRRITLGIIREMIRNAKKITTELGEPITDEKLQQELQTIQALARTIIGYSEAVDGRNHKKRRSKSRK